MNLGTFGQTVEGSFVANFFKAATTHVHRTVEVVKWMAIGPQCYPAAKQLPQAPCCMYL